jgi:hypothetical protein
MTRFLLSIILILAQTTAFAGPLQSGMAFQGVIAKSDGSTVAPAITFEVQVLDPSGACVLYDEEQSVTLNSQASFNLLIGKGSTSFAGNKNPATPINISSVFDNSTPKSCGASTSSYTPTANDIRHLRIQFYDGTQWTSLGDSLVSSTAFAEHASDIQGMGPSSFIQANSTTAQVTQTNVESVFKSSGMVADLIALIMGSSSKYLQSNGSAAPVSANAPTAPNQIANKGYVDSKIAGETVDPTVLSLTASDIGKQLSWDGSKWVATAASVSGINQLTGDVTASGTGSVAATIAPLAVTDSKIASVSASKITGSIPYSLLPSGKVANTVAAGDDSRFTDARAPLAHFHSASDINAGVLPMSRGGTGSGSIAGIGVLLGTDSLTGTSIAPVSCQAGKVIGFDLSGKFICQDPGSGSVTNITAGAGLTGGSITSSGTIAIDFTQVAALSDPRFSDSRAPTPHTHDASDIVSGIIPMSNGGTGVSSIAGIGHIVSTDSVTGSTLSPVACAAGQTIGFAAAGAWTCQTPNSNFVTSVSAGSGLTGGPITSTGSLAVDFTKVAALTDSRFSPTPAVGVASNFVRVNAAGTAYEVITPAQVSTAIGFNPASFDAAGAASTAQASAISSSLQKSSNLSDLVSISTARTNLGLKLVASSGLYSDLTGLPTLGTAAALSSGTSANNVVQYASANKLPAADGSSLTGITSAQVSGLGSAATASIGTASGTVAAGDDSRFKQINGISVSTTAPTNGQILVYNSTLNIWAPSNEGASSLVPPTSGGTGLAVAPSQTGQILVGQSNGTYALGTVTGTAPITVTQTASGPVVSTSFVAPVTTVFLANGTYTVPTTPRSPIYLRVRMVGAGGGGAGIGSGPSGGNGTDGGPTTFGTILTANGGLGGKSVSSGSGGGAGGTVTAFPTGLSGINVAGAAGDGNQRNSNIYTLGGAGGQSVLGGRGAVAGISAGAYSQGNNAAANSGSGGSGASNGWTANQAGTGGGGAGAYIDVIVPSPAASYSVGIGAFGFGGPAGSPPNAQGGAGGSGMVEVTAYFQ